MMLVDYFGVFSWISGKRDEISKSGYFQGPTPQRRDPTQQRKSTQGHGMSTPRCGMSTLRCGREGGLNKPWVR